MFNKFLLFLKKSIYYTNNITTGIIKPITYICCESRNENNIMFLKLDFFKTCSIIKINNCK